MYAIISVAYRLNVLVCTRRSALLLVIGRNQYGHHTVAALSSLAYSEIINTWRKVGKYGGRGEISLTGCSLRLSSLNILYTYFTYFTHLIVFVQETWSVECIYLRACLRKDTTAHVSEHYTLTLGTIFGFSISLLKLRGRRWRCWYILILLSQRSLSLPPWRHV